MKNFLRFFYLSSVQINVLIKFSIACARIPLVGRALSLVIDNAMLTLYGLEVVSPSLQVCKLVVGHSTGVVLGGNGVRCSGKLHVSSGVVFGRRYEDRSVATESPFFDITGDLTVGANSVLLGPLKIKGPVIIGALSLVTHDILEPGVYVGTPVKKIRDLQ